MATKTEKVRWIFEKFDTNHDDGLNRSELEALITAVNPDVKFTDEQISSIIDEVFRIYSDYVADDRIGLSFEGLLCTYNDGSGDVDLDFSALCLGKDDHDCIRSSNSCSIVEDSASPHNSSRTSPSNGVVSEGTAKVIDDLEKLIRKRTRISEDSNCDEFSRKVGIHDSGLHGHGNFIYAFALKIGLLEKKDHGEYGVFLKELKEIRKKVDNVLNREEAFDGHMAMGKTLHDHHLCEEALESYRRASKFKPNDACLQFRMGNCLHYLGKFTEAKKMYYSSLKSAEKSGICLSVIPQIHVNLGIVLEQEGMLINACDHYREATVLCPTHYRAFKLWGSALFGLGEYRQSEKALEEAIFLNPNYTDAYCDLGSVLHAIGENERAILAYQKVIDLKPDHMDALYNLGGLLMDVGRYERASEMFKRVLMIQPTHWQAQLNRAITEFSLGDTELAKMDLKHALKMSHRVELYDFIVKLKHSEKKSKWLSVFLHEKGWKNHHKDGSNPEHEGNFIFVESSRFKLVNENGTSRERLAIALHVREIQKSTRLDRCDVNFLKKIYSTDVHVSCPDSQEKSISRSSLETILQKLLHFLKPETFQEVDKTIEQRILSVLDATGSGRVDFGMFCAVIAPICDGSPAIRKKSVFEALHWRSTEKIQHKIEISDALICMNYLKAIYFPSQQLENLMEIPMETEHTMLSFPQFIDLFDDIKHGFGFVLSTLVKLEKSDRVRHQGKQCDACPYEITGPMFKETTSNLILCSHCYSSGKVPSTFLKEEYKFTENWFDH